MLRQANVIPYTYITPALTALIMAVVAVSGQFLTMQTGYDLKFGGPAAQDLADAAVNSQRNRAEQALIQDGLFRLLRDKLIQFVQAVRDVVLLPVAEQKDFLVL